MENNEILTIFLFGIVAGMLLLIILFTLMPSNIYDSRGVCTGQGLTYLGANGDEVTCGLPIKERIVCDNSKRTFNSATQEWSDFCEGEK